MEITYLHGPAPLYTNSYIALDGEGAAVVIDPAAGAGQYREILEKKGAKLAAILLTHGHYDHVGAVRALRQEEDPGERCWKDALLISGAGVQRGGGC